KTLSSSAVFVLLTALLLAATKRVSTSVVPFGIQSAIITAQVMATAYTERSVQAWIVAALVFSVKVVTIPIVLLRMVERLKVPRAADPVTTPAQSVFLTVAMIFLAYAGIQPY